MDMEKLISDHLAYACGVAKKFLPQARAFGLESEEVFAQARLATVEAAWAWARNRDGRGEFKSYLAVVVNRVVREFVREYRLQLTANNYDNSIAALIFKKARERGARVADLDVDALAAIKADIERSGRRIASLQRLLEIRDACASTQVSLDAPVVADETRTTMGELIALPESEVDGRAWRMNPEQLLIAREESKAANRYRRSPEKERQLFYAWVDWLPKLERQVMYHMYIYPWRSGEAWRSPERVRKDGERGSKLSKLSAEEIAHIAEGAISTLRSFARGDFSKADFEFVVSKLPKPLVQQFVDREIEDPFEKAVLEYGLIREYEFTVRGRTGKPYRTKGKMGVAWIARRWKTRLEKRLGRSLTKEEAQEYVRETQRRLYRKLAVQTGIAPPAVLDTF